MMYGYWLGALLTFTWAVRKPLETGFPVSWEWTGAAILSLLWPVLLPYLAAAKLYNRTK